VPIRYWDADYKWAEMSMESSTQLTGGIYKDRVPSRIERPSGGWREPPTVQGWLSTYTDERTRKKYQFSLHKFEDFAKQELETDVDVDKLLEIAQSDPNKIAQLAKTFRATLISKDKYAPKSARNDFIVIKSFFTYHGIDKDVFENSIRRGEMRAKTVYVIAGTYSQENVARMAEACKTARDKAIVCVVAHGQRGGIVSVLRVRNIKEVWSPNKEDVRTKGPYIIRIDPNASDIHDENQNKTHTEYKFPVGEDTARFIRREMDERVAAGESVDYDSYVFRSYCARKGKLLIKISKHERGPNISRVEIHHIVTTAADIVNAQVTMKTRRGATVKWIRPHGFRRYFKERMRAGWSLNAISPGINSDLLLDYWLGHDPPYGGAYDHFTDDLVRREYGKAEAYVSVSHIGDVQDVERKIVLGQLERDLKGTVHFPDLEAQKNKIMSSDRDSCEEKLELLEELKQKLEARKRERLLLEARVEYLAENLDSELINSEIRLKAKDVLEDPAVSLESKLKTLRTLKSEHEEFENQRRLEVQLIRESKMREIAKQAEKLERTLGSDEAERLINEEFSRALVLTPKVSINGRFIPTEDVLDVRRSVIERLLQRFPDGDDGNRR